MYKTYSGVSSLCNILLFFHRFQPDNRSFPEPRLPIHYLTHPAPSCRLPTIHRCSPLTSRALLPGRPLVLTLGLHPNLRVSPVLLLSPFPAPVRLRCKTFMSSRTKSPLLLMVLPSILYVRLLSLRYRRLFHLTSQWAMICRKPCHPLSNIFSSNYSWAPPSLRFGPESPSPYRPPHPLQTPRHTRSLCSSRRRPLLKPRPRDSLST